MSEQRSVSPPPSRIGPTEPDDTMVICPVCTSQFRAIPLDVQRQLAFLSAPERGERGTSRLGSSARTIVELDSGRPHVNEHQKCHNCGAEQISTHLASVKREWWECVKCGKMACKAIGGEK